MKMIRTPEEQAGAVHRISENRMPLKGAQIPQIHLAGTTLRPTPSVLLLWYHALSASYRAAHVPDACIVLPADAQLPMSYKHRENHGKRNKVLEEQGSDVQGS